MGVQNPIWKQAEIAGLLNIHSDRDLNFVKVNLELNIVMLKCSQTLYVNKCSAIAVNYHMQCYLFAFCQICNVFNSVKLSILTCC